MTKNTASGSHKFSSILHGIDKSEQNAANIKQNFQVSFVKFSKNLFVF
jgi:hypothetical protein